MITFGLFQSYNTKLVQKRKLWGFCFSYYLFSQFGLLFLHDSREGEKKEKKTKNKKLRTEIKGIISENWMEFQI